eukprot:bmy_01007T0
MYDFHHWIIKMGKGPRENPTCPGSPRDWGWSKTQKPDLLAPTSEISEDVWPHQEVFTSGFSLAVGWVCGPRDLSPPCYYHLTERVLGWVDSSLNAPWYYQAHQLGCWCLQVQSGHFE